jgi:hypothetical protein
MRRLSVFWHDEPIGIRDARSAMAEARRDRPPFLPFSLEDACRAAEEWGANCGPAAIAAVMGMTLEQVRPYLGEFERKGYTNPTLMFETLDRIGRPWRRIGKAAPSFGLARIQWEGPWTEPGVPARVAYRHSHWVGWCRRSRYGDEAVFDVNALGGPRVSTRDRFDGWVCYAHWSTLVVPFILANCEPKANGRWHVTHGIEVEP